jgi:hypothetical protein
MVTTNRRPAAGAGDLLLHDMPMFVLAGAPKCATTALSRSLARHPDIAFASPKEPFWFGSDLKPLRERIGIRSIDDYATTFAPSVTPSSRWIGEGSTLYLSSPDALDELHELRADARVICTVRNPVDIAHAFHMQMVFAGFEPVDDFEQAWHLQARRLTDPPLSCPVPRLLQYREIAGVGRQLERLLGIFSRHQVHVVLYDDFVSHPNHVLTQLASFLEIDDDLLQPPEVTNSAMVLRSPRLGRALRSRRGRRLAFAARRHLPGGLSQSLAVRKEQLLRRAEPRPPLSFDFRRGLAEEFEEELDLLETQLDRDLRSWTAHG